VIFQCPREASKALTTLTIGKREELRNEIEVDLCSIHGLARQTNRNAIRPTARIEVAFLNCG